MVNNPPENPAVPGVPTTRRSLGYQALLVLAQELLIARFALTRALDKLTTEELLDVLDEVSETLDSGDRRKISEIVTPRNQIS